MYCTETHIIGYGEEFAIPDDWNSGDISNVIEEESRRIDALTGQRFEPINLTLFVNGSGTPHLPLVDYTSLPINSITNVYRRDSFPGDGVDDFEANGELIGVTTYTITPSKQALERVESESIRGYAASGQNWQKGFKNYRVKGAFGWSSVPEPIRLACALMVRERMTPGSSKRYERFVRESYPDGYSYERSTGNNDPSRTTPPLTGITVVDRLLYPFVAAEQQPVMIVPM